MGGVIKNREERKANIGGGLRKCLGWREQRVREKVSAVSVLLFNEFAETPPEIFPFAERYQRFDVITSILII